MTMKVKKPIKIKVPKGYPVKPPKELNEKPLEHCTGLEIFGWCVSGDIVYIYSDKFEKAYKKFQAQIASWREAEEHKVSTMHLGQTTYTPMALPANESSTPPTTPAESGGSGDVISLEALKDILSSIFGAAPPTPAPGAQSDQGTERAEVRLKEYLDEANATQAARLLASAQTSQAQTSQGSNLVLYVVAGGGIYLLYKLIRRK